MEQQFGQSKDRDSSQHESHITVYTEHSREGEPQESSNNNNNNNMEGRFFFQNKQLVANIKNKTGSEKGSIDLVIFGSGVGLQWHFLYLR